MKLLTQMWHDPNDHSIGGLVTMLVVVILVSFVSDDYVAWHLGGALGWIGWVGWYRKLSDFDFAVALMWPIYLAWSIGFGIPILIYGVISGALTTKER